MVAKPMGAFELAGDRAREWFAFEGWSGTSINAVTGGADLQDLPLPLLLVVAGALGVGSGCSRPARRARRRAAGGDRAGVRRRVGRRSTRGGPGTSRGRCGRPGPSTPGRTRATRHLAAEDGPLYAFIEKVTAKLPAAAGAGVHVRRRALLPRPRRVSPLSAQRLLRAYRNTLPATSLLRPGDYVVVWQRRGVQYDASARKLRWDGQEPLTADALLVEPGGALFVIR